MKYSLVFLILLLSFISSAQNVGVGTTTPVEKLDVNGNINVTGTIKANGVDGQPNQVLMKNSSGVFVWGSPCGYNNKAFFDGSGVINWTVPANVTRLLIEAWGAGGGGSTYGGGGGGAYLVAAFTVAPGDNIAMNIGQGGTSGSGGTAGTNGGTTTVNVGTSGVFAGGGNGAGAATQISPAYGGIASVTGGFENYFAMRGLMGRGNEHTFVTNGTSTWEVLSNGDGGNAGNSVGTGGLGTYRMILTTAPISAVRNRSSAGGSQPGGGGGAGYSMLSGGNFSGGNSGANGSVVIHY
jgi:hypothetical protein